MARRYIAYRDSPSAATLAALSQLGDKVSSLLDLSQVPPAARAELRAQTFVWLWEVIARLEVPNLDEIPDAAADREGEPLKRWRIPHTEIAIARVDEGPQTGEYLFSADTVSRARSFYEMVRELSYLRPMPVQNPVQAAQRLTGWMIPMVWVKALPEWANTLILGMVLWRWVALLLLFGLAFGAVIALFR